MYVELPIRWEDPYPPRLSLRKVVFPIRCAVDVLPSEFEVYVDDPMRWDVEREPSEQEV